MNIEEDMKIWEERSNDEFGSLLKSVIKLTNEYFTSDIDEDGMTVKNPIQYYSTLYTFDGNRKYVLNAIRGILYNYDILGNDKEVDSLIKQLNEIIQK